MSICARSHPHEPDDFCPGLVGYVIAGLQSTITTQSAALRLAIEALESAEPSVRAAYVKCPIVITGTPTALEKVMTALTACREAMKGDG